MDNLRDALKRFKETKENYSNLLHKHQELRKKCDIKLNSEMNQLVLKLDELYESALVLLESFHHYGDEIKFPVEIYEGREDCLIFQFTREGYTIYLNNEENALYKSTVNIDDLPTSCYELLVINKDIVVEKAANQIRIYFDNEISKMNKNIENENSYYDMLTRNLFPEEVEDE